MTALRIHSLRAFLALALAAQAVPARAQPALDAGPEPASEPEPEPEPAPEPASGPEPGQVPVSQAGSDSASSADHDFASPEAGPASTGTKIVYVLERIDIVGNRTREDIIRRFVPLTAGDRFDVDNPQIERIRWRLMGTGWFNDVHLRLDRGSARGRVVLVVEVEERNTLVISRVVAGLARVVTNSNDADDELRPYFGLGLTESNLFGLGIGISASAVISELQGGFELRYHDPMRLGGGFDLTGRAFYNDARDFFGRGTLNNTIVSCPEPDPVEADDTEEPEPCDRDVLRERAVVIYDRFGIGLGTGHDITSALRYELDWLGELVDVGTKPQAASTLFGEQDQEYVPIDFHIDDGVSRVSSLHFGLILDARDDPAFPTQGQLLRLDTRLASSLIGSTYDFARVEATFRHYQPLPWHHSISFGLFLGTVFGRSPFFYRFYAADLSDLLPSRVQELNLDHRRTHNLLDTSIKEFDKSDLAARIDFEYLFPLDRGGGEIRGIDAYAGAGLFLLAERSVLRVGLPGYEGIENLPIDLTFDIGIQADTSIGVFKIGFSSLIGFLPDLGREAP